MPKATIHSQKQLSQLLKSLAGPSKPDDHSIWHLLDTVSTSARSGRQCTTNLGLIMLTRNECVAHVYKSLETALRHYKNSITARRPPYSKEIGGKGRLTDKWLTTCKIMLRPLGRTKVICKEWNTSVAIKQQILVNEHLPLKSNTSIVPQAKLHGASFGRKN